MIISSFTQSIIILILKPSFFIVYPCKQCSWSPNISVLYNGVSFYLFHLNAVPWFLDAKNLKNLAFPTTFTVGFYK